MQTKFKVLSGLVIAFACSMSTAYARNYRTADMHDIYHPTVQSMSKVGDAIAEKTNGKYKVKVYANGALGSEADMIAQVRIGAMDMIAVNISNFQATLPEAIIPSLPFLFRDAEHFRKAMSGPTGDKLLMSLSGGDFIALAIWESGSRSFYANKPIRSPADLRGAKIAVEPGATWSNSMVEALGATPLPMRPADVNAALTSAQVDVAENTVQTYNSAKGYVPAPIYSQTQHAMSADVLVFSKKVWDTLTKEEQQVIRDSVKSTRAFYSEEWDKKTASDTELLKKEGVTVVEDVNKKEFAAVMSQVWEKFTPKPEMKAIVQEIVNIQ